MDYRPVNIDRKYNTKRTSRAKQLAQAIELAGALYRNQAKTKHIHQQQVPMNHQHYYPQLQQHQYHLQQQQQQQHVQKQLGPMMNIKNSQNINDNQSSINHNSNISYYVDHYVSQRHMIKHIHKPYATPQVPLNNTNNNNKQKANYVHKVVKQAPLIQQPQPKHHQFHQQTPICIIQRHNLNHVPNQYQQPQLQAPLQHVRIPPQTHYQPTKFKNPFQFWNPLDQKQQQQQQQQPLKQPSIFRAHMNQNNENINRMFDQTIYRTNRLFWTKDIDLRDFFPY